MNPAKDWRGRWDTTPDGDDREWARAVLAEHEELVRRHGLPNELRGEMQFWMLGGALESLTHATDEQQARQIARARALYRECVPFYDDEEDQ